MNIWAVDFEFVASPGENPRPLCVVAHNLVGGQQIKEWIDPDDPGECPYPTGPDDLMVAYYASAEIGCHLALGWPIPARVIDLCAEFKCLTSGLALEHGRGQLGALLYFGITCNVGAGEKRDWQMLAGGGANLSAAEKAGLLDYCEEDVIGLAKLWEAMFPRLDICAALTRGRYMVALASVERAGIPIDVETLSKLDARLPEIKPELIAEVDADFGVYNDGKFSSAKFEKYLTRREIPWPLTDTGALSLADNAFKRMAQMHPELHPLRELRNLISRVKLYGLHVGSDGRNRCLLSAFGSKTGRNQPSNVKFIFGPSAWMRHLIRPEPGRALAYIDYSQQEFGIAASLSKDVAMMTAYLSDDPYLAFAKMAGAVPEDATKQSHPTERDRFKVCALAVQFGMGAEKLAESLGLPAIYGRDLLEKHHRTFPDYWAWLDRVAVTALRRRYIQSTFGWRLNIATDTKPTTIANFPCQANGADMLRLALIGCVENGIQVAAPVHDALLIEAPAGEIEVAVKEARSQMAVASRMVLDGFTIATDAQIYGPGERYTDGRGTEIWEKLLRLL